VSNTPGYPGNLLDFFLLEVLEFFGVSWKFHGAMAFVAFDMMQLWLDDIVIGE